MKDFAIRKASIWLTLTLAVGATCAQTPKPLRLLYVQACEGPVQLGGGRAAIVGLYLTRGQAERYAEAQRRYQLAMLGRASGDPVLAQMAAGMSNEPPARPDYVERAFDALADSRVPACYR